MKQLFALLSLLYSFGSRLDWKCLFFVIGISGAVMLRSIHYEDWMIVKSDQIRDAMVSFHVVEDGAEALPLLGPRAGGTDLRLGPMFYYFQSLSGILFDSASPGVLAFPVLIFSLLSIPLFFLLSRRLFDRDWSMILTIVFSYGFLGIEYSRFSWNPNSTMFFSLLFFYAFLRLLSEIPEKRMRWYVILGIAYGIVSQLHFTVSAAIPVFIALFAWIRFSRFRAAWSWGGAGMFLLVVAMFYIPVIIGDVLNHGKNASEFFEALGSKGSDKGFLQNLIRVTENFGTNIFRIVSGYFGGPRIFSFLGVAFLAGGMGLSAYLFRKESDDSKRDVLLAVLLWIVAFFLFYIPVATSVDKPRFYLPILFVPTLFLGMISLIPAPDSRRRVVKACSLCLLGASFLSNGFLASAWLLEIRTSKYQYIAPKTDTIVLKLKKDSMWWSWGMVKRATEFIIEDCPHENIVIDYRGQAADFMHTFLYAFRLAGDDRIRRSTKYDGPSFCRYLLTKSKPENGEEGDTVDMGDLRIVLLEKRGGNFDAASRKKDEESNESTETWGDIFR